MPPMTAPIVTVFALLLAAGIGLVVSARRGGPDAPRPALLGSGVAVILASCAGFASVLVVGHYSARAAERAQLDALEAEREAQEAIRALIEQGNRLAAEAAAERDASAVPAPAPESDAAGGEGDDP